ncbi:MAG: hypothetical protein HY860_06495 [Chlamydiales bacterium]|nr:hypothetical protein [Chlamydiales bacterium]
MRLLKTFIIIFLVIISFIISLPFILSTKIGKHLAIELLNRQLGGNLQVDSLQIHWFEKQEINNILYQDGNNTFSLAIHQITISDSLIDFIFHGFQFDSAIIDRPTIYLNQTIKQQSSASKTSSLAPILLLHHLMVKNGSIAIQYENMVPLSIKDIEIGLDIPTTKDALDLQLFAKTSYEHLSGILDIKCKTSFDYTNLLETLKFQLFANMQDFPLEGIDEALSYHSKSFAHLLADHIGPVVNLKGKATNIGSYMFDLDVQSKYLNGKISTQQDITFGKIKGRILPTSIALFLPAKDITLTQPVDFILNIQELKIPPDNAKIFSLNNMKITASIDTSPIMLNNVSISNMNLQAKTPSLCDKLEFSSRFDFQSSSLKSSAYAVGSCDTPFHPTGINIQIDTNPTIAGLFSFDHSTTSITGDSLGLLKLKEEATGSILNERIKKIAGESLSITQSADVTLSEKGLSLHNGLASIKSPFIDTSLSFDLFSNPLIIHVNTPLILNAEINNDNYPSIAPSFSKQLSLIDPLLFQVKIKPFKVSLAGKEVNISYIEAQAEAKQANIVEHYREQTIQLENLKVLCTYDQSYKELDIVFNSAFPYDQIQGQIESLISLKQFNPFSEHPIKESTIFTSIQGTDIPSVFLGPWINDSINFSHLIGNTFSSNVKLSISPGTNDFEVNFLSDLMSCKASFDITSGIKLKNNMKVNWKITPAGFKSLYLMNKNAKQPTPVYFALNHDSDISLTIDKFISSYSLIDQASFDPNDITLKGSLKITGMSALDIESNIITNADEILLYFNKKQNLPALFETSAEIASFEKESPDNEKGFVQSNGSIAFSKEEPLGIDLGNFNIQLQMKKFPTTLIDLIAHLSNLSATPPSWVLGAQLFGSLNADITNQNGTIQLTCNSSNASLELNSVVINNKLMLKDPFTMQLQWSENLDKLLFNKASIYAIDAAQPISLKVDQRGFMMSLKGFNVGNIQAPHILLQLGKIAFYNKGNVSQVSSIFKLKDNKKMDLWFAPFYLHLQQGSLDIERTEILIDNKFHVCTWGNVNLLKQYVNMKLGLTAQSLSKALGIHNLPENYVLQIPLKGPYNNVSLDKGAAVAKIGLLVAKSQSKNMGTAGALINIFGELLNDQSSIPPPKKPYPWKEVAMADHRIIKKERTRKKDKEIFNYSIPIPNFEPPEITP